MQRNEFAQWTRRRLLQSSGFGMAGIVAAHPAFAAIESSIGRPPGLASRGFLYAAVNAASEQGIEVFARRQDHWIRTQIVPSASPSSLAVSGDGKTLFVANCITQFGNLPTGSVESWAIDEVTGKLTFRRRQGLALTAVAPSEIALSGDGFTMAVLANRGTMYTLLSVTAHGMLDEVTAVRKELSFDDPNAGTDWSSALSAVPYSAKRLCFAPNGELLVSDLREKTLSTYVCSPGQIRLVRRESLSLPARARFLRARTQSQASWSGLSQAALSVHV